MAVGSGALSLAFGWRGWAMVVVGVFAALGFIASFKYTYVANVAIISATVPLMAAALEWLFLRVRPRSSTMVTALLCLAGVGIIVSGGVGGGHLFGDMIAVGMTAASALYMVMIRAFRDTPVVWVGAVSAYVLFAAGWLIVDPLAVSAADAWRMACFGFTFACAVTLWTEGTRLVPASEAGVLGSAEVPFAILFAWIFLAELPPACEHDRRSGRHGGRHLPRVPFAQGAARPARGLTEPPRSPTRVPASPSSPQDFKSE